MVNDEIIQKRNQAIQEANDTYGKIVEDQKGLIDSQGRQIDDFLSNSESAINQSVNNNVSALQNAQETARRQHEAEKQAVMNKYNNLGNNIDETTRIGALNISRNRIAQSEASLNDVIQEYNNQIAQAKITGQSILAQQALDMLKEKLDLYNEGMNNINDTLIKGQANKEKLIGDYRTIDRGYSSALNSKLDREESARQFNKELAYKNEQLNTQKKLKEQEYQLDLRDAKNSYYSRRSSGSSGSSGGYGLTDTSNSATISNNQNGISGDTKVYANYTPAGLTKNAKQIYDGLTKSVLKNGYVTLSQVQNSISSLPKKQQEVILSAFKQGSLKTSSSTKKTTTKKTTTKTTAKTTTKKKNVYQPPTYKKYLK